jgi:hypothetical protein
MRVLVLMGLLAGCEEPVRDAMPVPYEMACTDIGAGMSRCENAEAICYKATYALSCTWKTR